MRVDFILSKDPATEHGGDVAMTKLVMALARESFVTRAYALSNGPSRPDGIRRTAKPVRQPLALLRSSIRSRRSLIHSRFDTTELSSLLSESDADMFVAEHSYMAESFLRSRSVDAKQRLLVNSHVSEADVWRLTRPTALRWEYLRIRADERRVALAAKSVAYFDMDEVRSSTSERPYWLNVTLPPHESVNRAETPRRLVFLGDRTWPPNADAAAKAVELWPRISAGIGNAELLLVGKSVPGAKPLRLPGVRDCAFVDDLEDLLATTRALIAPVSAGGGVRVKILEAARIGLPVVGTSQALGSLGHVFPLSPSEDDEAFVQKARQYLLDPYTAGREGAELFESNASRWSRKAPHKVVQDWLVGK